MRDPRDPAKNGATEELDALLSARRDGVLDPGDEVRLDELLAASETARSRALAFERVDASLRGLAAEPFAAARLARIESALAARLAQSPTRGQSSPSAPPLPSSLSSRRRFVRIGLAAALAAGIVLAGLVWTPREARRIGDPGADEFAEATSEGIAVAESEEVDVALETPKPSAIDRDDLSVLGIAESSDLEVIEELELLEFLAARERGAGEPQG